MLADERDKALLWDMLQACREIREFTRDTDWEDFIRDRKLCLAIERCLEIVGEAAGGISKGFCDEHPEIPWHNITGMRHVLAHDYGRIDYQIVYMTVQERVPDLLAALDRLLPSSPPASKLSGE